MRLSNVIFIIIIIQIIFHNEQGVYIIQTGNLSLNPPFFGLSKHSYNYMGLVPKIIEKVEKL